MNWTPESCLSPEETADLIRLGWDGKRSLIPWIIERMDVLQRAKWSNEREIAVLKAHAGSNPNGLSFGEK